MNIILLAFVVVSFISFIVRPVKPISLLRAALEDERKESSL